MFQVNFRKRWSSCTFALRSKNLHISIGSLSSSKIERCFYQDSSFKVSKRAFIHNNLQTIDPSSTTFDPNRNLCRKYLYNSSSRLFKGYLIHRRKYSGIPVDTSLAVLPPEYSQDIWTQLKAFRKQLGKKLVVIDDDPTGTQSVGGVPVLAEWDVDTLYRELIDDRYPCFYLLSNIRAYEPDKAAEVLSEIQKNLEKAYEKVKIQQNLNSSSSSSNKTMPYTGYTIVSRSDSTLRGHFPLDVQCLSSDSNPYDGIVIMPFFQAGGRITINDIHYVMNVDEGTMLPAHLTPFAKDKAFGFKSSDLKQWVNEKTNGNYPIEKVISITLDDIRRGGPMAIWQKLRHVIASGSNSIIVVNAISERDLDVVVLGMMLIEKEGGSLFYRTAADFVATRSGIRTPPLLSSSDLSDDGKEVTNKENVGGLVVVGSYVPKTSEQLAKLQKGKIGKSMTSVELDIEKLLDEKTQGVEINRCIKLVNTKIHSGISVLLYTSRKLVQHDDSGGLFIGSIITDALVTIVKSLSTRPKFLIAKGGITSNDIATRALCVKRAMVKGPILPGVPVWTCDKDSLFPGLNYIVFPGNVGGSNALTEALLKLISQDNLNSKDDKNNAENKDRIPLRENNTKSNIESAYIEMLSKAQSEKRAIGAFNVYNIEGIKAVADAVISLNAPAILQLHPASLAYGGISILKAANYANEYVSQYTKHHNPSIYLNQPPPKIFTHLDHASDPAAIIMALQLGIDSIMADGSEFDFEQNKLWTKEMVQLAQGPEDIRKSKLLIPVEAELGKLAGEEDGLSIDLKDAKMTNPETVVDFLDATKVNTLAVTIGNVHGKYATDPVELDFTRLDQIVEKLKAGGYDNGMPLVLHGASGLNKEIIHRAIDKGICKFNVNTDLRTKAMEVIKAGQYQDLLQMMKQSSTVMQKVVEEKMKLFYFKE